MNKIIKENSPNLEKETLIQIDTRGLLNNIQDQKEYFPWCTKTLKTNKIKEGYCKLWEKGSITYKTRTIRITMNYLIKSFKDGRIWKNKPQALKDHSCQMRILLSARLLCTFWSFYCNWHLTALSCGHIESGCNFSFVIFSETCFVS